MIKYQEIMQALATEPISQYFPIGTAHSFPIPSIYESHIVDAFFTYAVIYQPGKNAEFHGPFARIGIISEENKMAFIYTAEEQPFCTSVEKVFFPMTDVSDKIWAAIDQYENLYPRVRELAFQNEIMDKDKKNLQEFYDAFQIAVCNDMKPLYQELSPKFFEWLEGNKL